jgi:hypothetical protein
VWHSGQIKRLAVSLGPVLGDDIKIVTAMAEIEQVPGIVVAPVLCVIAGGVDIRVLGARRRKELAGGACRKRNLDAAQANVPVDVVLENESRLEARVEKPLLAH